MSVEAITGSKPNPEGVAPGAFLASSCTMTGQEPPEKKIKIFGDSGVNLTPAQQSQSIFC